MSVQYQNERMVHIVNAIRHYNVASIQAQAYILWNNNFDEYPAGWA